MTTRTPSCDLWGPARTHLLPPPAKARTVDYAMRFWAAREYRGLTNADLVAMDAGLRSVLNDIASDLGHNQGALTSKIREAILILADALMVDRAWLCGDIAAADYPHEGLNEQMRLGRHLLAEAVDSTSEPEPESSTAVWIRAVESEWVRVLAMSRDSRTQGDIKGLNEHPDEAGINWPSFQRWQLLADPEGKRLDPKRARDLFTPGQLLGIGTKLVRELDAPSLEELTAELAVHPHGSCKTPQQSPTTLPFKVVQEIASYKTVMDALIAIRKGAHTHEEDDEVRDMMRWAYATRFPDEPELTLAEAISTYRLWRKQMLIRSFPPQPSPSSMNRKNDGEGESGSGDGSLPSTATLIWDHLPPEAVYILRRNEGHIVQVEILREDMMTAGVPLADVDRVIDQLKQCMSLIPTTTALKRYVLISDKDDRRMASRIGGRSQP